MKENEKIIAILSVVLFANQASATGCVTDTLTENSNGEMLQTLSGELFETLAGDSITAFLWLPMKELLVCGPNQFEYEGVEYGIFEVINIDDGESVYALSLKSDTINSNSNSNSCYEASIIEPAPFLGNYGEVFLLDDGSVWQIMYEYEYLYEYYPWILACPNDGFVVVEGTKLTAVRLR